MTTVVALAVGEVGLGVVLQAGDWAFVLRNAEFLLLGAGITVALTLTSVLLGLLAGLPAGIIEVYGSGAVVGAVSRLGVLFRGTPLLVILAFTFFVNPVNVGAFEAATLGLGLRSAAYQSQIFRGAIQSVSEGQMEAARSVGMSQVEAIRHVIVPQALRRSIPGFQNEFTIVLKDTSVAFFIGLAELLTRGFNLFTQTGQSTAILEVVLAVSLVYFVLTVATNQGLDYLGRRFAVPDSGGER
ncbi:amino acid ABC transporter permease [Haloglomus irregulare]|jgi:polar amino acid transport system permease protein|uniref:Amino acid ABC transporter permease n=1 Tax=Haloglomus irregulare TaxID=2234134 RepID=A0A554NCC9_9EURY|nr:amino acid ABC transporter permease [Haloglomus irregulare]TSD15047.1 amino acid ABC transporter permease [Haloglomus irregulare]